MYRAYHYIRSVKRRRRRRDTYLNYWYFNIICVFVFRKICSTRQKYKLTEKYDRARVRYYMHIHIGYK